MNLLSLPEEMLVSVFKYVDVPNLIKYRQISSKINAVALRNRFNEPRLKNLTFTVRNEAIEVLVETTSGFKCTKQFQCTEEDLDRTLYTLVQDVYLKVRYTRMFQIHNERRHQQIKSPNRFMNMLIDNSKKRQISGLSLFNLLLDVDFTLMRQLLTSFDIKEFSLYYCTTPNISHVDSLFVGLSLEHLILLMPGLGLSLRDLKMICKTNVPEKLTVKCKDITLGDAVTLLVDMLSRRKRNLQISFIGLLSNGLRGNAVTEILRPLNDFGTIEESRHFILITNHDNMIQIYLKTD